MRDILSRITDLRKFATSPDYCTIMFCIMSVKAKLVGIDVKITEESYTSKVDHFAFETLEKHDIYLGNRKKRGLFQSSVNQLINADINGSIGIARKVFGDSAVRQIIGSGLAFNPIRVNIL